MSKVKSIISYFMSENGKKGASVHQLSPEARSMGVAVRQAKADLIRQGYQPEEALRRARIRVKGESP